MIRAGTRSGAPSVRAQRAFEVSRKAIKTADEMLALANDVTR